MLVDRPDHYQIRRNPYEKDNESLAHTTWRCKYHIVFASKYRRQIIYGKYKASIGEIIRELCARKGVENNTAQVVMRQYKKYENKYKVYLWFIQYSVMILIVKSLKRSKI